MDNMDNTVFGARPCATAGGRRTRVTPYDSGNVTHPRYESHSSYIYIYISMSLFGDQRFIIIYFIIILLIVHFVHTTIVALTSGTGKVSVGTFRDVCATTC